MTAVDEIKARLDIVDVVSEHVSLQKSGRNLKGLCPFHAEKTPSFFVFPDTQTWHCFGACGTGGDLFSYVIKHDNLSFSEAIRILAQRAGVQLEPPQTRDTERQKHLDKLFEINAAAAAYFHDQLLRSARGTAAHQYAAQRGLNDESLVKFQVGFAPNAWHSVSDHLLERGYAREDLLEVGLVVARDDGGFHDRFRGRLIVPIRDVQGRVIGFGGRILGEGEPKYLNSPQTPLFNKSETLFGLDLAKGAIRATGQVVIVEGYMDVLQAHQAGFGNVVASMGTALTEAQLTLLKRLTKRYVLALDPDLAGDQGTLRGLAVARQTLDRQTVPVPTAKGWIRYESRLDAEIRIMALPAGQDPDDLIRDNPALWEPMVEAAIPLVDYYFQVITRDLDLDTARGKSEVVHRLAPILVEIRDEVEHTHYVQKLARLVRMDEDVVRRQLTPRTGKRSERRSGGEETEQKSRQPVFALEEYLLAALLRHPEFYERINDMFDHLTVEPLAEDDLVRIENRMLFSAWRERGYDADGQSWLDSLPAELQRHVDFLLARVPDLDTFEGRDADRDLERRALQLRLKRVERTNQSLKMLQSEALEQGDARASEYSGTMNTLKGDMLRLQRALAERTALAQRERERI